MSFRSMEYQTVSLDADGYELARHFAEPLKEARAFARRQIADTESVELKQRPLLAPLIEDSGANRRPR